MKQSTIDSDGRVDYVNQIRQRVFDDLFKNTCYEKRKKSFFGLTDNITLMIIKNQDTVDAIFEKVQELNSTSAGKRKSLQNRNWNKRVPSC